MRKENCWPASKIIFSWFATRLNSLILLIYFFEWEGWFYSLYKQAKGWDYKVNSSGQWGGKDCFRDKQSHRDSVPWIQRWGGRLRHVCSTSDKYCCRQGESAALQQMVLSKSALLRAGKEGVLPYTVITKCQGIQDVNMKGCVTLLKKRNCLRWSQSGEELYRKRHNSK